MQGLRSKAGAVNADERSISVSVCRQFPLDPDEGDAVEATLKDLVELLLDAVPSLSRGPWAWPVGYLTGSVCIHNGASLHPAHNLLYLPLSKLLLGGLMAQFLQTTKPHLLQSATKSLAHFPVLPVRTLLFASNLSNSKSSASRMAVISAAVIALLAF